jgi:hypothetical protein
MHQRQRIRDAAKDALVNQTAAEGRVFRTRVLPLRKIELPAIAVYTGREASDRDSWNTAPRKLWREMSLVIEFTVEKDPDLEIEDQLDDMLSQVERALVQTDGEHGALSGTCADCVFDDLEPEFFEVGEKIVGTYTTRWLVTYHSYMPEAEDKPLDDLVTVNVRTNLGNEVHEDNEAEDNIDGLNEE